MSSVLVTGSNRGLGLEWVRQYASEGWRVFATCRRPAEADELNAIASKHAAASVHRLDITDAEQVLALSQDLATDSIDVLVNNAGIYLEKQAPMLGALRFDDWARTFEVNTMGAARVTEAFTQYVARSTRRLVILVTTHMASIAETEDPDSFYYRSSKAALNAFGKCLSACLKPQGIGVLLLHPGWVKTRMGGPGARYSASESVLGMRNLVEGFTMEQTGRFLRFNGEEIPW